MFVGVGKCSALLLLMFFILVLFRSAAISAHRSSSSSSSSGGQRHWPRSTGSEDGQPGRPQDQSGGGDSSTESTGAWNSSRFNNCTHCNDREVKRSYRLELIKHDIMRKLRMSNMPNVTGKRLPNIPQLVRLRELHAYQNDSPRVDGIPPVEVYNEETDDTYATTIKMILFAQPAPLEISGDNSNIFYFNFQPELTHQQIMKATLGIYIRQPQNPGLLNTWILIYQLSRLTSSLGEAQISREMLTRKKITMGTETGQWHTFDIKYTAQRWLSHMNNSYGILIQASDGRGTPLAIVQPANQEEEVLKPYLDIHVQDQGTSRPKRTIEQDCDENSIEKRCCRYPLTVDFESFGWDWVIVPKRYSAYYCAGECTFLYYHRYPHTGIAQQAGSGGPCCSPRKTSPISMLYYDESMNIVYGRLPEMVVDQCDCS